MNAALMFEFLGPSHPMARSTPRDQSVATEQESKSTTSGESTVLSGSEYATVLEATKLQREEMEQVTNMQPPFSSLSNGYCFLFLLLETN